MKIRLIAFISLVFIVIIGFCSYNEVDNYTSKYRENVSGVVFRHFKEIRNSGKNRTETEYYLFVDTYKYGRKKFSIEPEIYVTYKDGNKITLADIPVFEWKETTLLQKVEYHGIHICTVLMIILCGFTGFVCLCCILENETAEIISTWYDKHFKVQ